MPLDSIEQPISRLTDNENIAIATLAIVCVVFGLAIIAQWLAAKKREERHDQQVNQLADKYDAGVKHAFSYVEKMADVVEKAINKIEILLDRAERN